ncbi:hypothetical protein B296_00045109 [Ensete ventricosum]|uniref:Uncharacterized protein n=1 Tax=Ensete ventricosum TaxID=4639 RepID=A0A426Z8H3_ENSVE|nr:hypothetical protein B296_00045109 [Ensete ventricosum]
MQVANARKRTEQRKEDLSEESLEIGKLPQCNGHLTHVIPGTGALNEGVTGHGISKRLMELLEALRECLLRLMARLLEATNPCYLLLRQGIQLRQYDLVIAAETSAY